MAWAPSFQLSQAHHNLGLPSNSSETDGGPAQPAGISIFLRVLGWSLDVALLDTMSLTINVLYCAIRLTWWYPVSQSYPVLGNVLICWLAESAEPIRCTLICSRLSHSKHSYEACCTITNVYEINLPCTITTTWWQHSSICLFLYRESLRRCNDPGIFSAARWVSVLFSILFSILFYSMFYFY